MNCGAQKSSCAAHLKYSPVPCSNALLKFQMAPRFTSLGKNLIRESWAAKCWQMSTVRSVDALSHRRISSSSYV